MDENFDQQLLQGIQSEDKLFELQKEHFHTVRTLITASAAIASVDLLAFQALQNIGLTNWFLSSVIFLYISAMIYSFYLTYSNNIMTRILIERGEFAAITKTMSLEPVTEDMAILQHFAQESDKYIKKAMAGAKNMNNTSKILIVANVLFIIGLFIPVVGFAWSLF